MPAELIFCMKGFALRLALKQRHKRTRKWPIKNMLCLNARQPGKVLNGLNARQLEIFTEFPLKDPFKLLDGK